MKETNASRMLDDAALAGIPIIAMTANAFDEDRRRALAAGMDAHLAKPVRIEALEEALTGAVGQQIIALFTEYSVNIRFSA